MSGSEPYECLRCGWRHDHVPAHGPDCRCATKCPNCGGVSMRQDDAADIVTPMKRMIECAERQAPMGPFDTKKFMDLLHELQKQRKETT